MGKQLLLRASVLQYAMSSSAEPCSAFTLRRRFGRCADTTAGSGAGVSLGRPRLERLAPRDRATTCSYPRRRGVVERQQAHRGTSRRWRPHTMVWRAFGQGRTQLGGRRDVVVAIGPLLSFQMWFGRRFQRHGVAPRQRSYATTGGGIGRCSLNKPPSTINPSRSFNTPSRTKILPKPTRVPPTHCDTPHGLTGAPSPKTNHAQNIAPLETKRGLTQRHRYAGPAAIGPRVNQAAMQDHRPLLMPELQCVKQVRRVPG